MLRLQVDCVVAGLGAHPAASRRRYPRSNGTSRASWWSWRRRARRSATARARAPAGAAAAARRRRWTPSMWRASAWRALASRAWAWGASRPRTRRRYWARRQAAWTRCSTTPETKKRSSGLSWSRKRKRSLFPGKTCSPPTVILSYIALSTNVWSRSFELHIWILARLALSPFPKCLFLIAYLHPTHTIFISTAVYC